MKKITRIPKKKNILVKVDEKLAKAIKVIGNGKYASGINQILNTFDKEIYKAAEDAEKAS